MNNSMIRDTYLKQKTKAISIIRTYSLQNTYFRITQYQKYFETTSQKNVKIQKSLKNFGSQNLLYPWPNIRSDKFSNFE